MLCQYCSLVFLVGLVSADYWDDRNKFLKKEKEMFLGGQIKLTENEVIVNEILMKEKVKEYMAAFDSEDITFPPARHFFEAKSDIDKSEVFKFIQDMPKGASLHGHDLALASTEYLLKNLTYRKNLYACVGSDDSVVFNFFSVPDDTSCNNWTEVAEMRRSSNNVDEFDKWLETKMTLVVPKPGETYSDANAVWVAFEDIFNTVANLIKYKPVFEDYLYQVMTEFYDDNVIYMEIRTQMKGIYNLDGTKLKQVEIALLYQEIVKKFVRNNPGFVGIKVIYAPSRRVSKDTIEKYLKIYESFQSTIPGFLAGFDLIRQEDKGGNLWQFVDGLLEFQKRGAKFFFHAGETNWMGTTDFNQIDAILLNTTRIGHAFAITKHPLAMHVIKERDIAIEISPISNQVLGLVTDLRNHPASVLMADNYPIVICSDDPSFWGAKGLSYDMYEAFMGFGGLNADLATLKQLAINSLKYSALPDDEKAGAIEAWSIKWHRFMRKQIRKNRKPVPQAANKRRQGANRVIAKIVKKN